MILHEIGFFRMNENFIDTKTFIQLSLNFSKRDVPENTFKVLLELRIDRFEKYNARCINTQLSFDLLHKP